MKLRLTCPHHKRFDPAKDAENGIKGGCIWCQRLWALHKAAQVYIRDVAGEQSRKGKELI